MNNKTDKKTSIGGQALLEGIMMRGPQKTAMAVRNPDGEIVMEKWDTVGNNRGRFYKLPFIRGVFNMYDSLTFGYKCLMRSAEIAGLDDDEPAKKQPAQSKAEATVLEGAQADATEPCAPADGAAPICNAEQLAQQAPACEAEAAQDTVVQPAEETGEAPTADADTTAAQPASAAKEAVTPEAKPQKSEKRRKAENAAIMAVSVILGLAISITLFLFLPAQITKWLSSPIPQLNNQVLKSVFEGLLRILIFVGYMCCMLLMKDMRRTFKYHGAEHKTIFCYEHGLPLTVENVRKQKRFHPRCGTSFIILALLVGIIISMFIPASISPLPRTLIKLCCLPIVVSVGYELIKLAGRHDNLLTKIISAPGKALQHITVLEPDDSMIECAIAAFNEVIPEDGSDRW